MSRGNLKVCPRGGGDIIEACPGLVVRGGGGGGGGGGFTFAILSSVRVYVVN